MPEKNSGGSRGGAAYEELELLLRSDRSSAFLSGTAAVREKTLEEIAWV